MKLFGKIIKDTRIIKQAVVEKDDKNTSFRDLLEECLILLCKDMDIQVPLWLKNNTTEFVRFHRTFFTKDHFVENIKFDKFEIRIEQ